MRVSAVWGHDENNKNKIIITMKTSQLHHAHTPPSSPRTHLRQALLSLDLATAHSLISLHSHTSVLTKPLTTNNLTPLQISSLLNTHSLTQHLLLSGCAPDAKCIQFASRTTAKHLALLLDHASDETRGKCGEAVHEAVWNGRAGCVEVLVRYGVWVGWKGRDGCSGIYVACVMGEKEMVKVLLEGGGDLGERVGGVSAREWGMRDEGVRGVIENWERERKGEREKVGVSE